MNLEQVREELTKLDPNNRDHLAEIARLKTLEIELAAQAVAEEAAAQQTVRATIQAEKIDGLAQYIGGLQLVYTIKNVLEQDSGPDTVGELSQQTNQLIHDLVKDHLQAELQELNAVIAEKDEKIRLLTKQSLEDRQTLDQVQSDLNGALDRNSTLVHNLNELENNRDSFAEELNTQFARIAELESELSNVKEQLEAAKKPEKVITPSQTVTERLEAIKKIGNKSTSEVLSAFEERMRSKGVDLPVIKVPQEFPFRTTTEEVAVTPVDQFQGEESNGTVQLGGNSTVQESNGATLEERVKTLESTVKYLEQEIINIKG